MNQYSAKFQAAETNKENEEKEMDTEKEKRWPWQSKLKKLRQ